MSRHVDISLRDFFAALLPEGFIECRAIDSTIKKVVGRDFVPAGDINRIEAFIERHAAVEVYFGVVSRSNDHDGSAKGCGIAAAVFCDIDFKDTPEPRARGLLEAFPVQPSITVNSGGGLHCYWLLAAPYDLHLDGIEPFKKLLRRIARALGGDRVAGEPARVLRIPQTANHKYPENPVVTIERFETGVRYVIDDFEFLPDEPEPERPTLNGNGSMVGDRGRAMERASKYLAAIPPAIEGSGGDHHTFVTCCKLVRDFGLSENEAFVLLSAWNQHCQPPWTERELRDKIRNAERYGDSPIGWKLAHAPLNGHGGQKCHAGEAVVSGDDESPRIEAFNLTDAGNGEFIANLLGDRWRHDHKRGRDLLFDRHRWREDTTGELIRLAKGAARSRYHLAADIPDTREREKAAKWAIQSEAKAKIDAALSLARSEAPIADSGEDWDNRPMLLVAGNGVVDLETGRLRDGSSEDRVTLHTPVPFDPNASCPLFERFLIDILSGDVELFDYVFRALGYIATGSTIEQVLFILLGNGANGKSVFLSILRAVLGELAYNMPFSTVEMQSRASIPNDVAALAGRRLVTASETNDGSRFNEARIKALTGCDPITARFLHGEFFTFRPVAKFCLSVNHKPRVADDSYGFWRRVRLIPFMRQFREDADPNLEAKLHGELPGILAFMVRGCLEWQRRGLDPPASVLAATDEYRQESDPLGQFIEERCTVEDGLSATAKDLYSAYKTWAESQGWREREIMSATAFGRRMGDRFVGKKSKSGKYYAGLKLEG